VLAVLQARLAAVDDLALGFQQPDELAADPGSIVEWGAMRE